MITKHSNTSPAAALAKQLYSEDANKVKPTWEQLAAYGATQSLWIARAEKLMAYEMAEVDGRAKILLSVPPIIEYVPL